MTFFKKKQENKWWLTEQDKEFIEEYSRGVRNRAIIVFLVGLLLVSIGIYFSK